MLTIDYKNPIQPIKEIMDYFFKRMTRNLSFNSVLDANWNYNST